MTLVGASGGGKLDMGTKVVEITNSNKSSNPFTIPVDLSGCDLVWIHQYTYSESTPNRNARGYCPVKPEGIEIRMWGKGQSGAYAGRSYTVYLDRIEVGLAEGSGTCYPDRIEGYAIK